MGITVVRVEPERRPILGFSLFDVPKTIRQDVTRALLLEAGEEIAHGVRIECQAEQLGGGPLHAFAHVLWRQFRQRDLFGADQAVLLAFVGSHVQAAGKLHGDEPRHWWQVESNRVQSVAFHDVALHVVLLYQLGEQNGELIPSHGDRRFVAQSSVGGQRRAWAGQLTPRNAGSAGASHELCYRVGSGRVGPFRLGASAFGACRSSDDAEDGG